MGTDGQNVTLVVRVVQTSNGDRNYMYMGVAGEDSPPGMIVGNTGNWPIGMRTGWVATNVYPQSVSFFAAHEVGHLFGLGDRYNLQTGEPRNGYDKNIMGATLFQSIATPTFRDIGCIGSKAGGTCN